MLSGDRAGNCRIVQAGLGDEHRAPDDFGAHAVQQCAAGVVTQDAQHDAVATAQDGGADQPLARDLAQQRVELSLQCNSRAVATRVAERDAWDLRQVVQHAVHEIDVIDV